MYATPREYVFTMKPKLQETHQLMRENMDVEQELHKTYYNRSRYKQSYKVGEEVLVFHPPIGKKKRNKEINFIL